MKNIILLEKAYNLPTQNIAKSLKYIIREELKELNVDIKEVSFTKNNFAQVYLEGDDEVIAANYLIQYHGTIQSISDIEIGQKIIGRLKRPGEVGFGIFVEVGARTTREPIDALFPLYEMRDQLAQGQTVSTRQIIYAYGFVDNLPMLFEITEKKVLGGKLRIRLAPETIDWLENPLIQAKECLIVCGATKTMIKDALKQTNHYLDIEIIERLGLLEYRLICKEGTRADGLIPEIGGLLKGVKLGAQISYRVAEIMTKE